MTDDDYQGHKLPATIYQGRKWDAPFTDEAIEGEVTGNCDMCQDPILPEDNALQMPFMITHLECLLRSTIGSIEHLEGRCICFDSEAPPHTAPTERTWREQGLDAVEWMVTHGRGRFHATE